MNKIKKWNLRKQYQEVISSTSYLTHGIHHYTAKLIPHIPRHFIGTYTKKNDLIIDPFCGSGTTLLEAKLMERNSVGIDINPLATLISDVKTNKVNLDELHFAIRIVKDKLKKSRGKAAVEFPNINYWFGAKSQKELTRIKFVIEKLKGEVNENIYKFLLVCFSAIIRKSSYADTRMAKTYKSKRVLEKIKSGWVPTPIIFFEETLDNNLEKITHLQDQFNSSNNYSKVFHGDAKKTSAILKQNRIKKIDFIITSPPYINAQDYFRSYKLELWWLGLATPEEVKTLNREAIGTEYLHGLNHNFKPKTSLKELNAVLKKIWNVDKKKSHIVYNYFENLRKTFKDFNNILTNHGHFCLITGCNTICGINIPTYKILTEIAANNGFEQVEIGKDIIQKRLLFKNRNHNGGIIKEEWITVFQKNGG